MSDYQAIYDAVRSRITGGNVAEAVADVARNAFDISYSMQVLAQEISYSAARCMEEITRPSAIYRPVLSRDGDSWCALYGTDLHEGIAGFGASPAAAMTDFDTNWQKAITP